MSSLSKLRNRLLPGVVITCIENTLQPLRNGAVQTVATLVGKDRVTCLTADGYPIVIWLPVKSNEMQWINRDTARWSFKAGGRTPIAGHSVTYRFGCRLCRSPDHDTRRAHTCTPK